MSFLDKMNPFKETAEKSDAPDYSGQNVDAGAEMKKRAAELDAQGEKVQDLARRVMSQEAIEVGLTSNPAEIDAARAKELAPEKTE